MPDPTAPSNPPTAPAPPPLIHPGSTPPAPPLDAIVEVSGRTRRRAPESRARVRPQPPARGSRAGPAHGPAGDTEAGPPVPRDRAILIRLARFRLLSLEQLASLVFPDRHRSRLSRRISALARDGWVTTWEEPRLRGGRRRFVLPTRRGLRWALGWLRLRAEGFAHAQLLGTMLGSDTREPLPLVPGRIPPFLPHLQEVHDVLVGREASPELAVTWASSWHRPFPNRAFDLALPQPDAVLILARGGASRCLVFLEHDRGTESLRHFARTKADRYRALAHRPALLRELTGFDTFEVWVTVEAGDRTSRRIEDLARVVRENFAERLFRVAPCQKHFPEEGRFLPMNLTE